MTSFPVAKLTEECNRNATGYDDIAKTIYDDHNAEFRSHLYYNSDHRFVHCLMEKVGCSFFKRFLYFFRVREDHELKDPFDVSLGRAHALFLDNFKDLSDPNSILLLQQYTKIIFVRDPYSRLFSGYVDKIFSRVNVWQNYNKYILHTIGRSSVQRACANDVTFAEFVEYFVQSMRRGSHMNGHFVPMHQHCKPCIVKYDFVGKLEHFDRDIRNMMRQTGLSNYTYILGKAKESSVRDELEDVTGILFRKRSASKSSARCFDSYKAAIRQWRKLQIKGLLSLNVHFPYSQRVWKNIDRNRFHNMLIAVHRLSKSVDADLRENRRSAMLEAYRTLSPETRDGLKTILEPDCKLFGYGVDPPFISEKQKINKRQFFDFTVL